MNKQNSFIEKTTELSFRKYYGKLYASLIYNFGTVHNQLIEDAIQTAFYKALKTWKPNRLPINQLNWLFISAKNDLINQLKKKRFTVDIEQLGDVAEDFHEQDPRLGTLLLCGQLTKLKRTSNLAITLFALKNIFGLSVAEISQSTLLTKEAIYKNINRTRAVLKSYHKEQLTDLFCSNNLPIPTPFLEDLLYSIFTVGYDTFDKQAVSPINEDLCFEAVSLTKLLVLKNKEASTKNLLALFCFHLARFPTRFVEGKLIPFFQQNRSKWDATLMNLGFYYLSKPKVFNKYYIEALMVSKQMTTERYDIAHWEKIITFYDLLLQIEDTPIIRLNRAYCLYKAKQPKLAYIELENISSKLPEDHFYYALLMGELSKELDPEGMEKWFAKALGDTKQAFRKAHIADFLAV